MKWNLTFHFSKLTCAEIGDGNINYIFRVNNENTGKSIIIKHADTTSRSNATKLDLNHNCIEAELLKYQDSLLPGSVPKVFHYDQTMCCICMEDLKDYENMRQAMVEHKTFPYFVDAITDFMSSTLMRTSDNILPIQQKRKMVQQYTNPELCSVTERLVYTDPYTDNEGNNSIFEPNRDFIIRELYSDKNLHLEVAKLKESFKSNTQSLIHGDLHTGSIMVKKESTKVLDPEFGCFAPAGYDVGNLIANLIFAWANAITTMPETNEKKNFIGWLEQTISNSIDMFRTKSLTILHNEMTDVMSNSDGFAEWFVADILNDTAGVTGLELNRRIVGVAKVKDITSIKDEKQRMIAERICVISAKECIMNRNKKYQKGSDYVLTINNAYKKAIEMGE